MAKRDSFWRGFLSVLGTAALLVLLLLAVVVAVVPAVTNGAALTVLTGSMRPGINPGDLVVVKGVSNPELDVKINDIITYMPKPDDPTLITHRVIGKSMSGAEGTFFITRGDNNGADDDPVYPKQVRGIYLYHIPRLGYLTNKIGGEKKSAVLFVGIGLIGYGLFHLVAGSRRRKAPPEEDESKPKTPELALAAAAASPSSVAIVDEPSPLATFPSPSTGPPLPTTSSPPAHDGVPSWIPADPPPAALAPAQPPPVAAPQPVPLTRRAARELAAAQEAAKQAEQPQLPQQQAPPPVFPPALNPAPTPTPAPVPVQPAQPPAIVSPQDELAQAQAELARAKAELEQARRQLATSQGPPARPVHLADLAWDEDEGGVSPLSPTTPRTGVPAVGDTPAWGPNFWPISPTPGGGIDMTKQS